MHDVAGLRNILGEESEDWAGYLKELNGEVLGLMALEVDRLYEPDDIMAHLSVQRRVWEQWLLGLKDTSLNGVVSIQFARGSTLLGASTLQQHLPSQPNIA